MNAIQGRCFTQVMEIAPDESPRASKIEGTEDLGKWMESNKLPTDWSMPPKAAPFFTEAEMFQKIFGPKKP